MEDDTIRQPPPGQPPLADPAGRESSPTRSKAPVAAAAPPRGGSKRRALLGGALAVGVAGAASLAAWWWIPTAPTEWPEPAPPRPESVPPRAGLPPGPNLLSEAEILEFHPIAPSVVRLRELPNVFVLAFADLDSQGAALNRVAALIEKRGLPRDRVLDDRALADAIARSGATAATYYYGHNYRAGDLLRFFAQADRQGIALNAHEQWVRAQVALPATLGLAAGDVAFISVPGIGVDVDAAVRRTILRHEIGHGHFFTNPVFAAHVTRVWRRDFTAADRTAFITFLANAGYDPDQEEIMVNETVAYLLFTPDERFFSAAQVGLTAARAEQLRAMLLDAAPRLAGETR